MNFDSYIVSETKTAFSLPLTSPPPYNYKLSRLVDFKAFTLAEVLITLSIIGVVAAMTVPTLMANVNKQIYVTGLKKAYNQLQNAAKMMAISQGCSVGDKSCIAYTTGSIAEQFKLAKPIYNCEDFWYFQSCFQTEDGMIFGLEKGEDSINSTVGVDVNGGKGPNIWGRDRFAFEVPSSYGAYLDDQKCQTFIPAGSKLQADCNERSDFYWRSPYNSCNQEGSVSCTGRVLEENAMNY